MPDAWPLAALLAVYNLSEREQAVAIPNPGPLTALLATTDTQYQPPGAASAHRRYDAAGDSITLPPYAAVLFRREHP